MYYEEGDTIIITKEQFDSLHVDIVGSRWSLEIDQDLKAIQRKKANAKRSLSFIFTGNADIPPEKFPLVGNLKAHRLSRDFVQLMVEWKDAITDFGTNCTNTYFLENMGFKFKQPEFEEIPIQDAPDEMLSEGELIIKHMMNQNNWTMEKVEEYLKPVYEAMNKAEAVFYRP